MKPDKKPDKKKGGALRHRPVIQSSKTRLLGFFDELYGIAESLDRFRSVIGDFDAEFLFERHHELNGIKAVCAQIVDERGAFNDFVFFNTKVLYYNLTNTICDVAHVKFLISFRALGPIVTPTATRSKLMFGPCQNLIQNATLGHNSNFCAAYSRDSRRGKRFQVPPT